VAVKVTAWFTIGEDGLAVKPTVRALATLRVWLDVAVAPLESVTVTTTVNEPDEAYMCDAGLVVDVPPSPKSQWKLSGPTPPVVVAVKDSARLASGEVGLIVKLTPNAAATVTVWLEVADAPVASFAVTVTTNDPDDE